MHMSACHVGCWRVLCSVRGWDKVSRADLSTPAGNILSPEWTSLPGALRGFRGGSDSKESACNAGDQVWSLGWDDALEKGMVSSILAWRIPWTEEPGRLQSLGSQRVGYNWASNAFTFKPQPWNTFERVPGALSLCYLQNVTAANMFIISFQTCCECGCRASFGHQQHPSSVDCWLLPAFLPEGPVGDHGKLLSISPWPWGV